MRERIILLVMFFQSIGDKPAKISEINKYLGSHDIFPTEDTISIDLKALEKAGIISRTGIGSGTKYWRGKVLQGNVDS